MMQLEPLLSAIVAHRKEIPAERALLVAISGIDGSETSFTDLEFLGAHERTEGMATGAG